MTFINKIGGLAISSGVAISLLGQAAAATFVYTLGDHPDGNAAPQHAYGLRLDSAGLFLSLDQAGADVKLTYDDVAMTAIITGTGVSNTSGPTFGDSYTISYSLTGVSALGTGFFKATGGTGTVTNDSTSDVINLVGKQASSGYAFIFDNDAHRLGGHTIGTDIVGRGWLEPIAPGTAMPNDWLFVAEPVPVPAAAVLFGTALLGFGAARKRRTAT
ncbi:MAG: VPLPA-CTERM sorting domain-containing protein [Pseudomonadota bacterium]